MTPGQWLIAGLIVFGWCVAAVVAYGIAKDNRRKMDRIGQINHKNALLAAVEELSLASLDRIAGGGNPDERLPWKIEEVRKSYKILECENAAASKIRELRQMVTIGIEDAAEYNEARRAAKEKAIRNIIADLEAIPKKQF